MQTPQVLSRVIDTVFNAVKIRAVSRDSVNESMALGNGGLGLDSVDILEIVVAVEHEYGVKIKDRHEGMEVFKSLGTIASFVSTNSAEFSLAAAQ